MSADAMDEGDMQDVEAEVVEETTDDAPAYESQESTDEMNQA